MIAILPQTLWYVSILVVVDCRRQRRPFPDCQASDRQVSILVVVDCRRQPTVRTRPKPRTKCFNPCCGGLQASTGSSGTWRRLRAMFQSLLWWIAGVNMMRGVVRQTRAVLFQSLLWWIAGVNDDGARIAPLETVSILVVVDCRRQRGRGARFTPCRDPSFNPCCGGLQASTREGSHREP